jgi:hypothetical protein
LKFKFQVDEDTQILFEIAVHFLQTYFEAEKNEAIAKVEQYYEDWKAVHDDDFYHEISSFETAVRVHYYITLQGSESNYIFWRHEKGYNQQPAEAAQYFRENYFLDVKD